MESPDGSAAVEVPKYPETETRCYKMDEGYASIARWHVTPVFVKAIPVPYNLKDRVGDEVDR